MQPAPRRWHRLPTALATAVVAVVAVLVTATACTSSTSGTAPSSQSAQPSPGTQSAPGSPQAAGYCDAWAQVRADFAAYRSVDVVNGGLNSVRAYLDRLDASLRQLRAAADQQLTAKVDAFTASLKTLGDTMTTATLPVDRRAEVRAASAAVDARWNELLAAASGGCPSVTPGGSSTP